VSDTGSLGLLFIVFASLLFLFLKGRGHTPWTHTFVLGAFFYINYDYLKNLQQQRKLAFLRLKNLMLKNLLFYEFKII